MNEIRLDPLTGLRTIIAATRAERPNAGFTVEPPPAIDPATDPFAEGNEALTPPELAARRPGGGPADGPGWVTRVVPNLYPALTADAVTPAVVHPDGDLFHSQAAIGAHEVIINGPQPVSTLSELPLEQLELALECWRERMRVHSDAGYVHLIVNERLEGGASLAHTHAQLFALPFVPAMIARERERFGAYATRTQGGNLLADLVQEEVRLADRVVAITDEAVLLSPYAARVPYQLVLVPRKPQMRFEHDGPTGATLLADALRRLRRRFDSSPPLNLWVRTAPQGAEHFCWRIDILPRLTNFAGLELGTGLALNIVSPEQATAELRDA